MSINAQNIKNVYQCDGVTRNWAFTFVVDNPEHIALYKISSNGVMEKITQNYYKDMDNKIVIYPTIESGLSPLPNGYQIVLIRETPLTQETDYDHFGHIDLTLLEESLDKLTKISQELNEKINRALLFYPNRNNIPSAEEYVNDLEELRNQCSSYAQQSQQYANLCFQAKAQCEFYYNYINAVYNSIQDMSGTLANRPEAPSTDVFYWATDVEQYYRYSTKAGKWFLIG